MPKDRSPGYSVFLRLTSLRVSLWFTVIIQALILGHLMDIVARYLLSTNYRIRYISGIAFLIGTCTSAGWFCGQLMADIFTAMLLLMLIIYFFIPAEKKWQTPLRFLFIFCCLLIHNSNLLIVLIMGILLTIYAWKAKKRQFRRLSLQLTIIAICGWLTLSTLYAISGKGFNPSPSSHVYLICRMAENGILDKFLSENCGNDNYKLCAYRDQIGLRQWDFMWGENSPLYKTGGWETNKPEYTRIINKTLTNPKYLLLHILKNSEATLRQLPLIYVGDGLTPQGEKSNPYWKVNESFNHELKEYLSCLQQTGGLKFEWWNALIVMFFIITCSTALFIGSATGSKYRKLFPFACLFIFINAAVTATFSTVVGRFESRVTWVIPFLCLLYIACSLQKKSSPVVISK